LPFITALCRDPRQQYNRGFSFDQTPMDEPLSDNRHAPAPPGDRLESWKEIATYLNRDVTTVQRWERREAMPVHRHVHDKAGSVFAFRSELDAWARGRHVRGSQASAMAAAPLLTGPPASIFANRRMLVLGLAAAIALPLAVGGGLWLRATEVFWQSPISDTELRRLTDFDGAENSAAVSRDGRFVAFLSDRDGRMDVWITQVGSGQFHNLTHGAVPELVNPSVRLLGFSPDGSVVTFWVRRHDGSEGGAIGTWAISTLGGQPTPYLEGVAESAWSPDGTRIVYHTPGPGDPTFVTDARRQTEGQRIFTASAGRHAHFPSWSPDGKFIYFVEGTPPDALDIWRVGSTGGPAERITSHGTRVSHPVLLDRRTLVYLATDRDGAGPWLYSMDVERRIPHKLSTGVDPFTSLAASADGRRLVATLATPKRTLWRLSIDAPPAGATTAARIPMSTGTGASPRMGPGYLVYVSETSAGDNICKVTDDVVSELWSGEGARILGGPAVAPDGRRLTFSARQSGRTLLYVMQADGTNPKVVTDSLDLQGAPAWAPDGQSITTAAVDRGQPRLFRVPINGGAPSLLVSEYSVDPAWSPDGRFVAYSGPDIGTTFSVKATTTEGSAYPLPALVLTRGARRLVFLPGGHEVAVLRGEIRHKNIWAIDLRTGAERQLTAFTPDFEIRDFDVSSDGRAIVVERLQEQSDVVLLDRPGR
jgi:Tol biopolymer transport system component